MSTPAFVEQLYLTFFGRPADDAGRGFWSQAIDTGALGAAEVTRHFLESAEFADAVAPVARLYYSAFDRIPDAAGLGYWLQKAQAGLSLDATAEAFAMSAEFAEVYGAARNPDFIDLIYQNALGRAPDTAGKAYWVEQMALGQASRADVLAAIAASPEMAAATDATIKIIAQYHGITGSAPSKQQIDSALLLDQPLALINQLFASSGYTGAPVPHPFVTDALGYSQGGGAGEGPGMTLSPVIDFDATSPSDGATEGVSVTPAIVLAFSQDVHAAGGMIYITDGAAQTVIDRATGLPKVRIVGATDTRAIDVNDTAHVSFDGERVTITISSALKSGVNYSVLIGKGVLVGANDMPFGGISDSGTFNFTPFGDSTPPEALTFSVNRESFNSGHTAIMTIEFSESVQAPDAADFDTPNGMLSDFASADDGRTWTALFTPTSGQDDTTNVITLRAGSVRDMAGNLNAGTASSNNYAVDTMVTPVVDSKLEFNDTGISSTDKLTNEPIQTLSGKFVGAPSGTTLKVVINGVSQSVPANADKTWSFIGGEFAEGLNTVIAYFTNPAGKTSATRSLSFTLDTTAPEITGLPETVDPASALALTFTEAVYWTDPEAEIVFASANGNVTVGQGDVIISEDGMTVTLATGGLLAPGTSYTVTLPDALTDAAGNPVGVPLSFATPPGPDLTAPPAPSIADLLPASDTGSSDSDNITRDALPQFAGTLGAEGDIVKLFADGVEVGSATVGADGAWTVAPDNALAEGSRSITVGLVDAAGNASDPSPALDIRIDTTAPAIIGTTPLEGGLTSGDVTLTFSEHVSFVSGSLKMTGLVGGLLTLIGVGQDAAWSMGVSPANADHSMLTVSPAIALGHYSLTLEADSIADVAGNAYAEIIGTPVLTFHISLL
ncbi:DUF4214 domain-containing protein [Massilia sp. RP-1-19]|uniref:DUF4214 domain-containing protein n=1 Tax=Massilia polaris TaxID=2728846 RepID=A0A848HQL8_9BURK|nr:DUF4214 domain-containing protein [Massilia polaris]NML63257.1 DUF4214 domain-containing protein [Massilia polaris]